MKGSIGSLTVVVHNTWLVIWANLSNFRSHDGGIFRVGNNVAYHIIEIGSIILDGKTNIDDVYFVDGLKHNLLSVGQLVDKGYQL